MPRRRRKSTVQVITTALERMLRRRGLWEGLREQRALIEWPLVVGPALARVTEPLHLRQGCLVVKVAGSTWRSELHHLLPEIKQRLDARLDKPLRDIRLVSGRVAVPAKPRGVRETLEPAPDDELDDLIERARRRQEATRG